MYGGLDKGGIRIQESQRPLDGQGRGYASGAPLSVVGACICVRRQEQGSAELCTGGMTCHVSVLLGGFMHGSVHGCVPEAALV